MALHIIDGARVAVVDLGVVESDAEVFGVGVDLGRIVELGHIDQTDHSENQGVYGVDWFYNVVPPGSRANLNLGWINDPDVLFGPQVFILPARSYRRIQLEGGGRILFEACIGDERIERYFELWKNGRPLPLFNVSNPIFSWRSPSGQSGEVAARIVRPEFGRVAVRLFPDDLSEVGTWLIQVRYVDELYLDNQSPVSALDDTPPYAPAPGGQEFWRYLPKAMRAIVRNEGGW